ncbi:hypothetical protein F4859DRAFT_78558 [Xylaria cf. heliscus]|nr:hypothetical protein F4859DRAFT_78558 [Xylaria cf. heliscus]
MSCSCMRLLSLASQLALSPAILMDAIHLPAPWPHPILAAYPTTYTTYPDMACQGRLCELAEPLAPPELVAQIRTTYGRSAVSPILRTLQST